MKDEGQLSIGSILTAIKNWIKTFNNDTAKMFLNKPRISQKMPELMQAACFYGNLEMFEFLESQGCSLTNIPKLIKSESDKPDECLINYRETPYMILAATRGFLYFLESAIKKSNNRIFGQKRTISEN